ncbi:MAG: SET domain-containing protein-lysine N-methyltransferase [Acidobacteria bacterium]|nr:SET domain-containing protein-lysine N-methyltransferase [Acidobacteriota bacterium]MBV8890948.1 SET domain-containing protein-lysine N-methyltransferase [Acidobacteriota bacterium]MBV9482929.1 SET domain-containing protein-lysine N-methyltransferase [Acidobacteriota bacterium]
MGLTIAFSNIHSIGCYTNMPIHKGTFIVEYTGPRLTVEEADERYAEQEETYLFGLADGKKVIDGYGAAAFINHCCEPNCESSEDIDGRVWIVALRDIRVGEELTYDYGLYDGDADDPSTCVCGAQSCRGTLYAPDEIKRRLLERNSAQQA